MTSCLMFDRKAFPAVENVRAWLASTNKAEELGDLCQRGKYSIAGAMNGRKWFVCRFADIKAGKVPRISKLAAGKEIESGVVAHEADSE